MTEKYYPDRDQAPYGVARLGDEYNLIDIFDKFPKKERNYANFYGPLSFALSAGITTGICLNTFKDRQLWARPHITIGLGALFTTAVYISILYNEVSARKTEAICRDYIAKYPEHFQPIKRKKFKDSLHPWHETRWYN